ncbi:hypothetical protein I3843_06G076500 [Carya illinoinensis]|uniref:Uncharacterized protein n=1 Tax=Carya illinoinensis TaxID=32201 RepID=A0A8T1Q9K3_CARIL|nr:hypothetical protein I3760_06G082800 [Carya illinoinensis]KAG6651004.1 hypothetical protein CIPAW_06G082200 [Carya illinoinensis]KAG6651005.1 hypothetical protein CIPAW_06G082200 [Carya illinoinensis]KAG6651006.1 hypothetical protein CIPAW_06G082200 [Carya illinoinensis]KAG6708477.1 hypothetical protein I3842_06G082600 [Carya illinoinensis]
MAKGSSSFSQWLELMPSETTVFRDVLGKRSGYERGLGEKVMPVTSGTVSALENGGVLLEDALFYKAQFEALKANVQQIFVKQVEFDKFMTYSMSQQLPQGEFSRETPGAV